MLYIRATELLVRERITTTCRLSPFTSAPAGQRQLQVPPAVPAVPPRGQARLQERERQPLQQFDAQLAGQSPAGNVVAGHQRAHQQPPHLDTVCGLGFQQDISRASAALTYQYVCSAVKVSKKHQQVHQVGISLTLFV